MASDHWASKEEALKDLLEVSDFGDSDALDINQESWLSSSPESSCQQTQPTSVLSTGEPPRRTVKEMDSQAVEVLSFFKRANIPLEKPIQPKPQPGKKQIAPPQRSNTLDPTQL